MKTVNMHEAKTNLSRLVEAAVNGEPFIIARAGKPLVKVAVLETVPGARLDFLSGAFTTPDDFDTIGAADIQALFEGETGA